MANHEMTGQFYYVLTNLAIALGMISASLALGVGLFYRKTQQYRTISLLFAGLFLAAGISRTFKAVSLFGYAELAADTVAGVFSIVVGIILWPMVTRSLRLPSYQEVERAYEEKQEAYKELEQQKRLFDTFMDSSPALAFLEDEEGRFIYVNNAFPEHFGLTKEYLIGQPSALWSTPDEAALVKEQIQKARIENRPISRIANFPKAPGADPEQWLVVRFPIPQTSDKALIGGMAVNVTSEFKSRELNSKLASIVEFSQDAVIGKDLNGNITSWNRGAEILYGYTPKEAVGLNMSILVPPERANEVEDWLDKVRRGVPIQDYRTLRVCKQGFVKDILESVSPIHDGQGRVTGAAVIARDITVLKNQQREIEELNQQLKSRVYELAESNAALQTARDQALEASNLKSAFVANISHEIRTPLSGILGLNEILLQNGQLTGDDLSIAQMVQQSAEALLRVVNDILDLSKIEAGKITFEYAPFNPAFLLQDCTRLMAPTAQQKGLKYELLMDPKIPETVYGDVSRLRQVLLNIIGNAIKFTENGSVTVSAHVVSVDEETAVLEFAVVDTGIGISAEDQRFLFMPFAQADNSTTRKFGGTGLGLTISKRFTEMMDGTITMNSQSGIGSELTIRIPFDRKKLHQPKEFGTERIIKPGVEPIPAALSAERRILVVEDNAVLQQLALKQLQNLGIDAEATVLGRDAIDLALSGRFDIVLMDINLPDISGVEATAAIRNLEHSATRAPIPIIALTAGAMRGDRERALAAGMNDYLAKPVAIEYLKRMLELWLGRLRKRDRTQEMQERRSA